MMEIDDDDDNNNNNTILFINLAEWNKQNKCKNKKMKMKINENIWNDWNFILYTQKIRWQMWNCMYSIFRYVSL